MYNESLKKRFLKEQFRTDSNTLEFAATTFEACKEFEQNWGADLCTKTAEELTPMVESLVGLRVKSKWSRINVLRSYVKWCLAIGVPNAKDGMLHVDCIGLGKVRVQMVRSPEHLQKYLDEICEPESEETIENTYRCYYWMAYGGIEEDDILTITNSDIDFERKVIHYKGRVIEIYRQAWPAFEIALFLKQFQYKHDGYPADKKVYRSRVPGDIVVRGIRSAPSKMTMRTELSRRSKRCMEDGRTKMQLSYFRVRLSGLFYRMYQEEMLEGYVDFNDAAAEFMEGKVYKLDSGRNTPEAKKRQIANDYFQDYQRWKAAFY